MSAPTVRPLLVPVTSLLATSTDPQWVGALCARPGEDPEDWHPFPAQDCSHAQSVCAQCPLTTACEAFGRGNGLDGVFGGQRLVGGRPA